jgi:RimJ/RimL family protein N-acetyltransferase
VHGVVYGRRFVVPELRTDRVLLRAWRPADREPFAAMNADPEVVEFLPGPLDRAASDALADRCEAHWAREGFGLWAVELPGVAPFVGFVGLLRAVFAAPFTPAVEVGWRLARDAWGHGYATEGGKAALRFGFEVVDLDEIVSFTTRRNVRSRRVMERLGMRCDPSGDFEHPNLDADSPLRPHVLYRLGRADWSRG